MTALAGIGADEAGDGVDEGRLAGAVGADQAEDLAGSDVEVDAVEGDDATEADGEVAHLEGGARELDRRRSRRAAVERDDAGAVRLRRSRRSDRTFVSAMPLGLANRMTMSRAPESSSSAVGGEAERLGDPATEPAERERSGEERADDVADAADHGDHDAPGSTRSR